MGLFRDFWDTIVGVLSQSGFSQLFGNFSDGGWKNLLMLGISFVLIYLAIGKGFEPLLLLPIAFGMLLTNLPGANMFHPDLFTGDPKEISYSAVLHEGGLLDVLYLGVKLGIYPCLIFLGIGAMTDFGPLIANPKSFLLGAAAQFGIFATVIGAMAINYLHIPGLSFMAAQACGIGIIGGADGPTAIWLNLKIAPEQLGQVAVAAYSYMALVPIIQPPIMRLLTTKKERAVVMEQLRPVSKKAKILFPIIVTTIVALLLPSAAQLVGCLMFGNLCRECGMVDRLAKTMENELVNIVTIFLGLTVGATTSGPAFINLRTIAIIVLGLAAFSCGTTAGVLFGKLMYLITGGKINPLIGSAGVSAVPMAARVSQKVGQEENPGNFLLMHAMGPNVAGVIGSAVAAGVLLVVCGG
ncbi:MAG: sodium ion-translocating decarboxylase subunit beta [Oscillospiraceae bacterium]|nr:sodium ion-translocating decarboxylase subunit beta [Oscillospiraceae bacterium]